VRALFAIRFAGMGGKGVVERLAVDLLRVLRQMVADGRWQVAIDAIGHVAKVSAPAGMT
jgi:hypothetical protein